MLYKIWNGGLLYQIKPHMFNTRSDVFTWIVMNTGIPKWLLDNRTGWLALDIAFYCMPLLYWLAYRKSIRLSSIVAILMLLINWIYVQCYTLYPANSIEGFIPWLLFPLLFICISLRSFYYVLHALRYFFLYFFASAGIWKIVQGGMFNFDQMSGVLLYQHKEYLSSASGSYADFLYWLINHQSVGYALYIAATALELMFIVGFFTRQYDKLLIGLFILFLVFDVLVMRIPYWEVTPFLIPLLFSRYAAPAVEARNSRPPINEKDLNRGLR